MKASTIIRILTPIILSSLISGCAAAANNKVGSSSAETSESLAAENPADDTETNLQDVAIGAIQEENNTPSEKTIVSVTGGLLEGSDNDGIYQYLGVPYADAKDLFTPAGDVKPWSGVREAVSYGNISYQSGMFGQSARDAAKNESNDAQNLNIWTPGTDDEKRPVMVWLHGGGFSSGSANEAGYDGENLSRNQNVVVVGVNHRLGVYGHLNLSMYGDKYKYSANVGMMDIVDALQWIQDNISSFGGDPRNVTLFGQSGGGAKVLAMMSSPYAKGLFEKGIVESGATEGVGVAFTTEEVSEALGRQIVKNLGLDADSIDQIQNVSYNDLQKAATDAQNKIAEEYKIPASLGEGYADEWEPVVDGDFLPVQPVLDNGFASNAANYPLLIGSNLNEWNYFMPDVLRHKNMTDAEKKAFASAYPNEDPSDAENVDTLLRLPILKITAHKADQNGASVYSYVFTKQDGNQGSYHGAELPYVFGNNAQNQNLEKTVQNFWGSFARDGVPSSDGADTWEPYTRNSGAVMIIDDKTYLAHHHDEKLLSILAPNYKW